MFVLYVDIVDGVFFVSDDFQVFFYEGIDLMFFDGWINDDYDFVFMYMLILFFLVLVVMGIFCGRRVNVIDWGFFDWLVVMIGSQ